MTHADKLRSELDKVPEGVRYCDSPNFPEIQRLLQEGTPAENNILYISSDTNLSGGQPLSVKVENDQLVIRIGIDTLAEAAEFEGREPFWQYDEIAGDFVQYWKIIDNKGWAEDVVHALKEESEDGSTFVTDLLDKACEEALDQGSLSVWNPVEDPDGPEDYD